MHLLETPEYLRVYTVSLIKTFNSLGNSYSFRFLRIHLSFSAFNFLVILEGWGHVSVLSLKRSKTVHVSAADKFASLQSKRLLHSRRVKRKPLLETEPQFCTCWEHCQSSWSLTRSPRCPATLPLKFTPSSYFTFDRVLHFSRHIK